MRASSCLPLDWMLPAQRRSLSGELRVGEQQFAEAEDAVERRAQFVAHRGQEIALEPVRFVQRHVRPRQFIDFAVQVDVRSLELVLLAHQVAQHSVEGVTEVFEFVAGLNFAADIDFAGGDGVADLLEVLHRLDDDVAHDEYEQIMIRTEVTSAVEIMIARL